MRVKSLEDKVKELEGAKAPVSFSDLEERLKKLENQYRMLNARISRKNNAE